MTPSQKYRDANRAKLNASAKARYMNDATYRERVRNHRFLREYGITVEQANTLIAEQGGKCAISTCGASVVIGGETRDSANIDHDHETGAVRGVLCGPCNRAIGALGDNAEGLAAALAYVSAAPRKVIV